MKYMAGLLITYVALNLMDGHGQPALLYIVPFTLGKSFFLSFKSLSFFQVSATLYHMNYLINLNGTQKQILPITLYICTKFPMLMQAHF